MTKLQFNLNSHHVSLSECVRSRISAGTPCREGVRVGPANLNFTACSDLLTRLHRCGRQLELNSIQNSRFGKMKMLSCGLVRTHVFS